MKYTHVGVLSCILQRLFIYVSLFPLSPLCCAEGTLLQSQLLLLELLRAQHDGILVHSGLQATGNQQEPHHLLLQSPDQLRHPHGPPRKRGEWSRAGATIRARAARRRVTIIRSLLVEKVIGGGGGGGG